MNDRPTTFLFGMPVYVSDVAYKVELRLRRVHKKRRSQSDHYHKRIQKKWYKRFGADEIRVPVAYRMRMPSLGFGPGFADNEVLVIHPTLYQQLKNATNVAGASL